MRSNETEVSDGGQERASIGVEMWKSCQKWRAQRSASQLAKAFGVRSIAWLDAFVFIVLLIRPKIEKQKRPKHNPNDGDKRRQQGDALKEKKAVSRVIL